MKVYKLRVSIVSLIFKNVFLLEVNVLHQMNITAVWKIIHVTEQSFFRSVRLRFQNSQVISI